MDSSLYSADLSSSLLFFFFLFFKSHLFVEGTQSSDTLQLLKLSDLLHRELAKWKNTHTAQLMVQFILGYSVNLSMTAKALL